MVLTAEQAAAVLAKIDVVEQDGELSFEEFERAFAGLAEDEIRCVPVWWYTRSCSRSEWQCWDAAWSQ